MAEPPEPLVVAERLFAAIEAGDIDAVRDLYAESAEIWHNTDGRAQSREENLRTLRWVVRSLDGLRYDDVRRDVTPSGFVQRHVLRASGPEGTAIEIPACIVATVHRGRVTHLDEYLDSAHVARITGG